MESLLSSPYTELQKLLTYVYFLFFLISAINIIVVETSQYTLSIERDIFNCHENEEIIVMFEVINCSVNCVSNMVKCINKKIN